MKRDHIPFLDLRPQHGAIHDEMQAAIKNVFDSSVFASGPAVEAFEKAFASYCNVRHCVAVNSGTSALHLALIACGVGPGDEVITVPLTFVATAWAISYVGARPVFVDIEPETYTMDVTKVKEAITPRTRAVLPVHLYGQMADLDPLLQLCKDGNLHLIEDAAQAHGACYHGHRAGGVGRVGCFSFYPTKNLGGPGEGGAVTTNDGTQADRIRALRDHAQSSRYRHEELGFNYRMSEIQAAVLGVKLPHLEGWNSARLELAGRYERLLADSGVKLPVTAAGRNHAWHLYVVRHGQRDGLQRTLAEVSIATMVHYPTPVHLQPAYAYLGHRAGDFPISERVTRECLSLPMYPGLQEEEQLRIAFALRSAMGH
jgi:dTDP-4-amino-4,6-dideoxygalactose transaminase